MIKGFQTKKLLLPGDEFKITTAFNLVVVTYYDCSQLRLKDFLQLYKEYRILKKRNRLYNEVVELRKRLAKFENYETVAE